MSRRHSIDHPPRPPPLKNNNMKSKNNLFIFKIYSDKVYIYMLFFLPNLFCKTILNMLLYSMIRINELYNILHYTYYNVKRFEKLEEFKRKGTKGWNKHLVVGYVDFGGLSGAVYTWQIGSVNVGATWDVRPLTLVRALSCVLPRVTMEGLAHATMSL